MALPGQVSREVGIGSGGKVGPLRGSLVIILPWTVTQFVSFRMDSPSVADDLSKIAFLEGQGKGFEEFEQLVGGLIG